MSREKKQDQIQHDLLYKLLPILRTQNFQDLRMNDIAKFANVSRATLYKYFPNKRSIMEQITTGVNEYIQAMKIEKELASTDCPAIFQKIFEETISIKLLLPDNFINELQIHYPDLYEKLLATIKENRLNKVRFYKYGIDIGIFNNISIEIILLQEELIPRLWDTTFLLNSQLTVKQALIDYYQLCKVQLFTSESIKLVPDSALVPKIEYLVQKINNLAVAINYF